MSKPKSWRGKALTLWGAKLSTPGVQKTTNPKPGEQKRTKPSSTKTLPPGFKSTALGCQTHPSWGQTRQTFGDKSATPQGSKPPAPGEAKRRGCCGAHPHQPGDRLGVLPQEMGNERGEPFPRGRQCLRGCPWGRGLGMCLGGSLRWRGWIPGGAGSSGGSRARGWG